MVETYMTTEELAEMCRTSPSRVRYWKHGGRGPRAIKVGRRVLYAESDVREWLEAARSGGDR